ncbi:sensitive to high expression protein 9, mitochondrial [Achaetomium macrosporum]|uniref:Sensitive to high expression protein 9, mitochondrial n=1 Tax=Achaetomium macrosporum TaxID=79813 RepID=A0AAN7C3S3_9PEZI|nr:sensitive to high expression protein 9, mitochondrial [Achaetomium macrosporum]
MSPNTALRLAVRPLRGAAFLDQLAIVAAPRPVSQFPPITLCVRCSVAVGVRLPASQSHARHFSTAPPPPRHPPPQNPADGGDKPKPETAIPKDAASPTPASPPSAEEPTQPGPEPSTPSTASPEPQPSQSEQHPAPPHPKNDNKPPSDRSLPSFTETHRHPLSARFSTFMDNLQSRALTATQKINDLTGYSAIEAIKIRNSQLEREHAAAQARLRAARHNYKSLTSHRASTQREVTTLLARKDTWNPADLERFTTLYRSDHELEAQVAAAAAELTEAEADEARLSGELNAGILKRYHEEQIWSDRIRRQSTWGTWGLMGVNVVLFLVLQFVAEPWRRKRLMRGIAEREEGVFEEVKRELEEVKAALEASALRERQAAAAAAAVAQAEELTPAVVEGDDGAAVVAPSNVTVPVGLEEEDGPRKPWKEFLLDYWEDPELLKADVLDLTSERKINLRMRDVSLIALQGAVAGATVAATLAFALLRSSRT